MQPPIAQRTFLLNQAEFAFTLRRLFTDRAQWTRELILLSALEGGATEAVQARLNRNAQDLSALIRQLYGERNATEFEGILKVENALILESINAIKANDTQRIDRINTQWYAVADNAAQFLSTMNRFFDQNEFQTAFYDLIYKTQEEAMQILSGDYGQSISAYDQIMDRLMQMADDITFAVMRQLQI